MGGLGSQLQSMVVEALAGCAKSSTMVLIAVFLKHNDYKAAHCRFVVFGKSNQQDLKDKIESATGKPSWGKIVQTLHSFAFEIWRGKDKTKDYKIDDRRDKYQSIAQSLGAITKSGKEGDLDKKNSDGVSVCCEAVDFLELVEKLRIYCVREITPSSVLAIAQRCQMDTFLINQAEKLEKVAYWCQRVLEEGARLAVEEKWIDYTDMLWLLWKEQGRFRKAIDKWRGKLKFIGVDESQDMNLLQIAVLKILHNPQTNFFCFVGDRWQAIYGFRGSESDCMDIVQREFKCDRFYLPLNFRCGKKHLALVRQIFPHIKIEPRSDAPEGVIRYIKESELSGLLMSEREKIPTFGIARKNASLINMAIQLALRGIPVKFKEGLVSKKIYNFVRQAVSCSGQLYQSEKFPQVLKHYAEAKIARLPQNNRLIVEWEIRDLEKCCLLLFYQYQIRSLSHWNQVLEMIFEKKEAQIEFHTIHSGKGGEGERVLFVYPDETPLSYPGQTSEERQQEQNAIYIALTRCLARNDRPSGELWLVIREVMEKGKSVLKLPVWLPTSKKSPDNK
ncbi:MAG: ATP-dependent helicase [Okeania sp. SIO2H7]|nr:ATP-dependent helicase [Okeania sp. SIO2H7]